MALFIAKHLGEGVTEYISRRTGRRYTIVPDISSDRPSFIVEAGIDLLIGHDRARLINLIEQLDKASAEEGGVCSR